MHPFYEITRGLVQSFSPKRISLFYANDILAVCFVPGIEVALNGTTFRKDFREAGLNSDWFKHQPCQKLTLIWAASQGEYQAVMEEPAALDASARAERITRDAPPQPLVSLLFEGLKTDAPDQVDMWPYLLGIPVYWNGTQYEAKQHTLEGWTLTIGKSKVQVVVSRFVKQVTMLHAGKQIVLTEAPVALPLLIFVDGQDRPDIDEVLARTRTKLRGQIEKDFKGKADDLANGVSIGRFSEIIQDRLLKKLLGADKQGLAISIFCTLTGLGIRWGAQWELDDNGELHYWTEPKQVVAAPLQLAAPSSILAAVLPPSLPIVPDRSAPWGSQAMLPVIDLKGECRHEDVLSYSTHSIGFGDHALPYLVSFGESPAIVNGEEDTLAPGLYLVRGQQDFLSFWRELVANTDLLRLYLVCIQMMTGGPLPETLRYAIIRDTDSYIDAELVASFLIKEDFYLEDWRDRKAAGLLHKVCRDYPLRLSHELGSLADGLSSKKVQGLVKQAIQAYREERHNALESVLAEFAPPEPEPVRTKATEAVSA